MDDGVYSEANWIAARSEASITGLPGFADPLPLTDAACAGQDATELAHALIVLLSEAERSIGADPTCARCSIAQARLILEGWGERREEIAPRPSIAKGGLPPPTTRRLRAHIEENLGDRILIADLAAITRLSARHFSMAFSQSFGHSPHAYIVRRRIERAKHMMLHTNEPLCQIAVDCGLADQSHLNKWFRRLLGVSPSAWRRCQLA